MSVFWCTTLMTLRSTLHCTLLIDSGHLVVEEGRRPAIYSDCCAQCSVTTCSFESTQTRLSLSYWLYFVLSLEPLKVEGLKQAAKTAALNNPSTRREDGIFETQSQIAGGWGRGGEPKYLSLCKGLCILVLSREATWSTVEFSAIQCNAVFYQAV